MSKEIKKLCSYMYDCVRQSIKSAAFNNLNSNKDNRVLIIKDDTFRGDDKDIIDIMTKAALNKSTMDLLYSDLFIKGARGKNKFYTPLLYSPAELSRVGNKIKLYTDGEATLNIGIIANLTDGEEEKIENVIRQLMDVSACDLPTVMRGLLNLDGVQIIKQKTIILARLPDSTAGLLNELKIISNEY